MNDQKNNTVDNSIKKLSVLGNESEEEKNNLRNSVVEVMSELSDLLMLSIDAGYNVSIMMHNSYAMNEKGEVKRLGVHYSMFVPVVDALNQEKELLSMFVYPKNKKISDESTVADVVLFRGVTALIKMNNVAIQFSIMLDIEQKFDWKPGYFYAMLKDEQVKGLELLKDNDCVMDCDFYKMEFEIKVKQ